MFEKKEFWPAHRVMIDREYYHLENMMNFEQLPRPTGFKLSVFSVKWVMSTASPVRQWRSTKSKFFANLRLSKKTLTSCRNRYIWIQKRSSAGYGGKINSAFLFGQSLILSSL